MLFSLPIDDALGMAAAAAASSSNSINDITSRPSYIKQQK
jgi:hypothetical protein